MNKKIIVLATGVFDVLHQAHVTFLAKAKEQGDILWVGIESDVRVRQLKGENRPINHQKFRQQQLEKLNIADRVFVLPEKFNQPADYEQFIAELRPDILAVSSHTPFLDRKKRLLEKYGGRVVVVLQHNPKISTTILLNKSMSKK